MKNCFAGMILAGSLLAFGPLIANGNSTDDAKTIAALDTEYQAAVKNGDAATMNRILADDFVVVTGSGKVYTKADLLEMARTQRVQYEHQEDSNQTVRVWHDTAVVTTAWIAGTTVEVCQGASAMYGLIAKLMAAPGKRDELMTILIDGTRDMPGCFSYIVGKDSADENVVWVTETWDSQASHDASLTLPAVKNSITQAKPLIAGFEKVATTTPVGGVALPRKSGL